MSRQMERLLRSLETVPEKELLIFGLARELTKDGAIDEELSRDKTAEVNLAVAEAQSYAAATAQATRALLELPARTEGELQWMT